MRFLLLTTLLTFLITANVNAQSDYLSQVGEKGQLHSEVLGTSRSYYVQLPDSYDANRKTPYPVAFILDGESLLPTLHTVHSYYSGGFMPEMILVGIDNSVNRTLYLTISAVDNLFGQPAKDRTGKATQFLQFIKSELIPHIDKQYNTSSYRTLIGHSYGGLFTVNALLNSPETFDNYLAIDPSLDWDNERPYKEFEARLDQLDFTGKSLFLSLNGQLNPQDPSVTLDNLMDDESPVTGFARAIVRFSNLLKENTQLGLQFDWKHYPRDLHGTIPLPSMMDGLIGLFEWFQMEDVHKFNDFETAVADLASVIQHRADKLKNRFGYVVPPYPADLMYHMSQMCMDMGQFEKAKMFLDQYIQFYPQSANAYDSMADFFERQKQPKEALEYAKKAYELSGSEYHKKKVERLSK